MMRPTVVVLALLLLPFSTAEAKKKDKHKDKDEGDKTVVVTVRFTSGERDRTRGYFQKKHGRGKCPPGLAKKNNGCLPPGHAKKRYVVGQALPPTLRIEPVPAELRVVIGVPPEGYEYGILDGDLVKLAVGTMLVVDAIDGLVD
jgi:hypothetical protein